MKALVLTPQQPIVCRDNQSNHTFARTAANDQPAITEWVGEKHPVGGQYVKPGIEFASVNLLILDIPTCLARPVGEL